MRCSPIHLGRPVCHCHLAWRQPSVPLPRCRAATCRTPAEALRQAGDQELKTKGQLADIAFEEKHCFTLLVLLAYKKEAVPVRAQE